MVSNELGVAPVGLTIGLKPVLLPLCCLRSKLRMFPEDNAPRAEEDEFESTKGFAKLDCWPSGMELVAVGPDENQFRLP